MNSWLSHVTAIVLGLTALLGRIAAGQTPPPRETQKDGTPTILFQSMMDAEGEFRPGNGALYSVNADGTGLKRLTSEGDHIMRISPFPRWSPDGQHIAYVNWPTGIDGGSISGELYVMDRDGGNRHLLVRVTQTFGQVTQQITGVAWSPDGKMLAVTRLGSGLFLVASNGRTEPRLVLGAGARNYSSPEWSPDGKRIALYVYEQNGVSQMSNIHVINADGSGDIQVAPPVIQTRMFQRDIPISWSRDSRKVYFALLASSPPSAVWNIQGANADGSGFKQLTQEGINARFPVVSPDGSRIAFTGTRPGRPEDIFVMNEDGSGVHAVTSDSDWACSSSAWSPDGKRLVLSCHFIKDPCRMAIGCNWRLFLISPDNPPLKLTPIIDRDAMYPSVAPSP